MTVGHWPKQSNAIFGPKKTTAFIWLSKQPRKIQATNQSGTRFSPQSSCFYNCYQFRNCNGKLTKKQKTSACNPIQSDTAPFHTIQFNSIRTLWIGASFQIFDCGCWNNKMARSILCVMSQRDNARHVWLRFDYLTKQKRQCRLWWASEYDLIEPRS